MGRKICVIILGLIFVGLVGEVRGQLPIYQDWVQTYAIPGEDYLVGNFGLAIDSSRNPESYYFAATVQHYYEHRDWQYITYYWRDYLCLMNRDSLIWHRQIGHWGGSWIISTSAPICGSNNTYAVMAPMGSVRMYSPTGDTLWTTPSLLYPAYHSRVQEIEGGVLASTEKQITLFSFSGNTLSSRVFEDSSLVLIAPIAGHRYFLVISDSLNNFSRVIADSQLASIESTALTNGYSNFTLGRDGSIYCSGAFDDSGFFVHKYGPDGQLQIESVFRTINRIRGTECFLTSEDILCIAYKYWTNNTYRYPMLFLNEDLDSLGARGHPFGAGGLCADMNGGFLRASAQGNQFHVTRYSPTPTAAHDIPTIPNDIEISAYPNPFNASTTFSFDIPELSLVHLDIYDIAGRLVTTLMDQSAPAGSYTKTFDASEFASGVYIYSVRANDFQKHGKILLLK